MPLQYDPKKVNTPYFTEGESLTEQEHKDSCDINKMIRALERGQQVRGGNQPRFGIDDTTMDGVQFRLEKERLEAEMAETELPEEHEKHVPEHIKKKFKPRKPKAEPATASQSSTPNQPAPQAPSGTPDGVQQPNGA